MSSGLKPCPFCGNKDVYFYDPFEEDNWEVCCDNCTAQVMFDNGENRTKEEAASLWNKRAD